MKEEYRKAFSEIEQIIELMPNGLQNKIPNKFKNIISSEKSKIYKPNIKEPFEECEIMYETKIILSVIYRDFLCSESERNEIKFRDSQKLKEYEDELRKKYNPDDIFKNKNIQPENKIQENNEEKSIAVIQEEKWYQKIFSIIKNIFKRK